MMVCSRMLVTSTRMSQVTAENNKQQRKIQQTTSQQFDPIIMMILVFGT